MTGLFLPRSSGIGCEAGGLVLSLVALPVYMEQDSSLVMVYMLFSRFVDHCHYACFASLVLSLNLCVNTLIFAICEKVSMPQLSKRQRDFEYYYKYWMIKIK